MKHLLSTTAIIGLLLVAPTIAQADLISIGLQETGVNFDNITVQGTNASGAESVGPVPYGTFTVTQESAQSQSDLGPPGLLNSQTLDISSASSGTLKVYVTVNGLTGAGVEAFTSSFALNADNGGISSVTEQTFLNTDNDITFGTNTPLAAFTFTGLQTQLFTTPEALTGGPFSVTEVYTIVATGTGNINATIDLSAVPVPEPGTLALIGSGLLAFSGFAWFRRRKNGSAYSVTGLGR